MRLAGMNKRVDWERNHWRGVPEATSGQAEK